MRILQFLGLAVALVASLLVPRAAAQASFTTIYTFDTPASGAWPDAVIAANGVLYGETGYGGACGSGTIFELRPPREPGGTWAESVSYRFTNQNCDGAGPSGGLVVGERGALYGTTGSGGAYESGTAFELQPPGLPVESGPRRCGTASPGLSTGPPLRRV